MKKEIVLSGVGGQGVVSVGEVMGLASLNEENINATMSASYGAEARGTFTKTDVVLSDGLVGYPNVEVPDLILCLAQVAYDRYVDKFTDDTLVFYDSDEVKPREGSRGTQIGHPFRKLAVELGSIQSANFIALGAMMKKTGLLQPESVEQGIEKRFAGKQKVIDSNRKAFEKGLTLE
ncbi:MAG: 2-oxoacid:acceptor oxidoreductase family protein [Acidaminococcus sp.]|uniref:2-oxoacid:acceptor oxidoreductase family protein n=1 Tax=Acidaminococcus sp. TaxID=1872103 RepID=UPI0026DEF5D8|nr:2-oxoacid:acceptor oxidoreductase family protein [Acidaminococcus sp.]MDO5596790.1 2-oxoacid:acceptor oxidoreductase family protein [Acidaminococcus sp.]